MKKRISAFFGGVLLSTLLCTGVSANTYEQTIQVQSGLNLNLNGKDVTPLDGSGKRVDIFLYGSTTYVPVRFISQYYGMQVKWDGLNATVYIQGEPKAAGTQSSTPPNASVFNTNIDVLFGIQLNLNGKTVQPVDASGKPVPVFLYGSTTYVPLRFISEYYGLEVYWDPSSATVGVLMENPETPSNPVSEEQKVQNFLCSFEQWSWQGAADPDAVNAAAMVSRVMFTKNAFTYAQNPSGWNGTAPVLSSTPYVLSNAVIDGSQMKFDLAFEEIKALSATYHDVKASGKISTLVLPDRTAYMLDIRFENPVLNRLLSMNDNNNGINLYAFK